MAPKLETRQTTIDNDSSWWYYSDTAYIIKWAVVAAIFGAIILFILIGYIHAQRRMKKGQAPLPYHRWLISRRKRERFFPTPARNNVFYYRTDGHAQQQYGQAYPMQPWQAPPPAYNEGYVPPYQPPPGSTKVNPDQAYAPPQGPPPPAAYAAGSSRDVPNEPRELDAAANASEAGRLNTSRP